MAATKNSFTIVMFAMQLILFILYSTVTEYGENAVGDVNGLGGYQVSGLYREYMDIHVMIFIGFGYLMTFLRSYMYGAVSLNFMVGVFAVLWGIITSGYFGAVVAEGGSFDKIHLDVESCLTGDFAAATALITFGAVLGKVSPTQLIMAIFFEMIFFSFGSALCYNIFGIADIGGTITIHLFGAFFGLGLSKMVSPKAAFDHEENASTRYSDMFSMVGTLFLFIYWPSFVGVLASGNARNRAILNTVLAISGSCMSTFFCSEALRGGKFTMVDIQNATLAGGVTVGAIGDFVMHPATAIFVGTLAGIVSTLGYVYVQGWVQDKLGISDTCGVLNLHGMPAILGAVVSVILAGTATEENYGGAEGLNQVFASRPERSAGSQATMQLIALAFTLVFSFSSGIVTGVVVKMNIFDPIKNPALLYKDEACFDVPASFTQNEDTTNYTLDEKIAKIEQVFDSMTGTKIELAKTVGYFAKTDTSVSPA